MQLHTASTHDQPRAISECNPSEDSASTAYNAAGTGGKDKAPPKGQVTRGKKGKGKGGKGHSGGAGRGKGYPYHFPTGLSSKGHQKLEDFVLNELRTNLGNSEEP